MIKIKELTPEVYSTQSRDFQFISILYDLVLNYTKTNAANLYSLPIGKNMNTQLLNLLALTLGFKATKNYNSQQLFAICSVLPSIIRHKGSLQALIIATNALLAAEGISQPLDFSIESKAKITLYISQKLSDLSLLGDLLNYILPAGISCSLVRENQAIKKVNTVISMTDRVTVYYDSLIDSKIPGVLETKLSKITNLTQGFEGIGRAPSIIPNVSIIPLPVKTTTPITTEEDN